MAAEALTAELSSYHLVGSKSGPQGTSGSQCSQCGRKMSADSGEEPGACWVAQWELR